MPFDRIIVFCGALVLLMVTVSIIVSVVTG